MNISAYKPRNRLLSMTACLATCIALSGCTAPDTLRTGLGSRNPSSDEDSDGNEQDDGSNEDASNEGSQSPDDANDLDGQASEADPGDPPTPYDGPTPTEYPVAFLAYPRTAEDGFFKIQSVSEVNGPYIHYVGTDLMIKNPDGSERVLVKGEQPGGFRAVHDFTVSLDGKSILYAHVRDFDDRAQGYRWADIFRVNIETGQKTQLTNSRDEWAPPQGAGAWADPLPQTQREADLMWQRNIATGTVWNAAPCEAGDGSIVFVSNRDQYRSPHEAFQSFVLYRMDHDGRNVEKIGHLNLGGAAHPTIQKSGRILWSSAEQQGLRGGGGNNWAIWSINPDGTDWRPELSSLPKTDPWHWQTETSDGSIVASQYYDARVYGTLHVAPPYDASTMDGPTVFGSPNILENPWIRSGFNKGGGPTSWEIGIRFSFQRRGLYTLTPWVGVQDGPSINLQSEFTGMVSQPNAIPENGVLLTWTSDAGDNQIDLGIYQVADIHQIPQHHHDMVPIVDRPDRHEWMGKPVVPFGAIYGLARPPVPRAARAALPEGTPFGVIGTTSMNWREIVIPNGRGLVEFADDEIEYLRIVHFNPTLFYSAYGTWEKNIAPQHFLGRTDNAEGFLSMVNERMAVYETLIPLKKWCTQAKSGSGALIRPGDCSADHVHYGPHPPAGAKPIVGPVGEKRDTSFKAVIPADQSWTFQLLNSKKEALTMAQTWHNVRPGESRTDCQGCHAHNEPTPFNFGDTFAAQAAYEVKRLEKVMTVEYFRDIEPIVNRRGLSGFGPRMWDTPAEDRPMIYGSKDTTIDDHPSLTKAEAELIRTWIDTGFMAATRWFSRDGQGQPVLPEQQVGPYADSAKPTLNVVIKSNQILVGAFDPQAGINPESLSIAADFPFAGKPAGAELAAMAALQARDHIWTLKGSLPTHGTVTVSVRDNQIARDPSGKTLSGLGNITKLVKTF